MLYTSENWALDGKPPCIRSRTDTIPKQREGWVKFGGKHMGADLIQLPIYFVVLLQRTCTKKENKTKKIAEKTII